MKNLLKTKHSTAGGFGSQESKHQGRKPCSFRQEYTAELQTRKLSLVCKFACLSLESSNSSAWLMTDARVAAHQTVTSDVELSFPSQQQADLGEQLQKPRAKQRGLCTASYVHAVKTSDHWLARHKACEESEHGVDPVMQQQPNMVDVLCPPCDACRSHSRCVRSPLPCSRWCRRGRSHVRGWRTLSPWGSPGERGKRAGE